MRFKIDSKNDKEYFCEKCNQFLLSTENGVLSFPSRIKNLKLDGEKCYFNCSRCGEEIQIDLK